MTKSAGVHAETGFALTAEPGADGLVKQVVATHVYCWLTARPATLGAPGTFDHHRAYRGDAVWLSPQEVERGQALGGLADPGSEQAAIAAVDALAGVASDDELADMDAGELAGYVTQNPGEAQRVYDLEMAQRRPRKTVIRAAGFDPETGERLAADDNADHLDGATGPAAVG